MGWQSVDTQSQLDALHTLVCWEDACVLEYHAGYGQRDHYPSDVSRSGYDRPDIHVLVRRMDGASTRRTTGEDPYGRTPFLELAFLHCDRLGADAFERLHLRGMVDSLKRVELLSSDGSTLLRASRLIYQWLTNAPSDGSYYWPRT